MPTMNRILKPTLSAMFLLSAALAVAQVGGERLAVVPFVNATGDQEWDTLARSMTDTIQLTLQLSGRYDVATGSIAGEIDPFGPGGPGDLSRLARDRRLDAAVLGRISDLDNGRIELEIAVWSSSTGQIVGRQLREAFGSFDILDAADELVIIASSALLGYDVDFGALVLQPSRPDVPYTVSLDGVQLGQQIVTVPQVLTGVRRIDISVETGGRSQLVFSAERRVRPGEALELSFGLPQVTQREQRAIQIQHQLARNLLGQPERLLVAFDALSEARGLLADARESDGLTNLQNTQRELEQVWQLEEEFFRLDAGRLLSGDMPDLSVIEATRRIAPEAGANDLLRSRVERNGAALYYLMDLRRMRALSEGAWDEADTILNRMEQVVTELNLDMLRPDLVAERSSWQMAREEATALESRGGRPWPYIGLVLGVGIAGTGGYLATAETFGLDPAPFGVDFTPRQLVQWSAIGGGGALILVSGVQAARNARAGRSYRRDWVDERYARETASLERVLEALAVGPESESARILVLGPRDALANAGGRPASLPLLVEQRAGNALEVGRGPVVPADATRLYNAGLSLLLVQ